MGDPKKPRRKWEGPTHPWIRERLQEELILVGQYGLRNKRELWIAKTFIKRIRSAARKLLALPENERIVREKALIRRLVNLGILPSTECTLDDVLSLTVESILERRLQTIVYKKGLAKSLFHARQLITHGHIMVNGRRVRSPGHLVKKDEEETITFYPLSPYVKRSLGAEQKQ
ncbi:MAG: 30S ribosomal protein S4 [Thermoprotei archaeon]|nr:MAG: 30S ribosomal protein S4 [Thermoprotei archaeon]